MTRPLNRTDRRTLLRATAGLTGTAALPTLTGCLGAGSDGGNESDGADGSDGDGADDTGGDGDDAEDSDDGDDVEYAVERVAEEFENPWGLAFLPDDGRLLVTERPGRLSLVDPADGRRATVEGAPEVHAAGQGGLLDVAVHP
ncbi:MAG: PQQ-dependent sugar dehydrogenase, partial [Halorubrum sp.]